MGMIFPLKMMKFQNQTVAMLVQHYKCTKCCLIIHFEMVNFMFRIYCNNKKGKNLGKKEQDKNYKEDQVPLGDPQLPFSYSSASLQPSFPQVCDNACPVYTETLFSVSFRSAFLTHCCMLLKPDLHCLLNLANNRINAHSVYRVGTYPPFGCQCFY